MPRAPLYPAGGDVAAWAHRFALHVERDLARIYPKSGTVSLSATTANTITDSNLTSVSRVFLQPVTSQAAAIVTGVWVSSKATGQFVVSAGAGVVSASCVFDYLVVPPPAT